MQELYKNFEYRKTAKFSFLVKIEENNLDITQGQICYKENWLIPKIPV